MLMKDCYVGMMVIATPEANGEYGITVEGVVGIVDKVDKRKSDDYDEFEDDPEIELIHIRPTGIQTSEEIMDLIIRAEPLCEIFPIRIDEFFDEGFWVSPKYFEPYYEEPKVAVSLLSYWT